MIDPPAHGTLLDGDGTVMVAPQVIAAPANLRYTPASGFTGGDQLRFQVSDGEAVSAPATVSITVLLGGEPGSGERPSLVRGDLHLNNGVLKGGLQKLIGQYTNVNGTDMGEGVLFLPGSPEIRVNGHQAAYNQWVEGPGDPNPSDYALTLNGDSLIDTIVTRTDPVEPEAVAPPDPPHGHRTVHINQPGDTAQIGDFATLKNLTFNQGAGPVAIPPGAYGNFTLNNEAEIVLGIEGAEEPAVYHFQKLSLNSSTKATIAGPVLLRVKQQLNLNAETTLGNPGRENLLRLELATANLTLNSHSTFYGAAYLPEGRLTVNAHSLFEGYLQSEQLSLNANGAICLIDVESAPGDGENRPPVAEALSLTTLEDTLLPIALNASDPDGDPLTASITRFPAHGVLTAADAVVDAQTSIAVPTSGLTFTPAADYNGTDSFSFTVSDGHHTVEATAAITIRPVNDLPVATGESFNTGQGQPLTLTLQAADADGDALRYSVVELPGGGVLRDGNGDPVVAGAELPTAELTYTPKPGFFFSDGFTFVALDSDGASAEAAILIAVASDPRTKTWTTTSDFEEGTLRGVSTDAADQLQLGFDVSSLNNMWIPVSTKGTVARVDIESGRVLGEYRSAPSSDPATLSRFYPSRVTIDYNGDAWIANRSNGLIVKWTSPNGNWRDKNGDGGLTTSNGLNELLDWTVPTDAGSLTALERADLAQDELIVLAVDSGIGNALFIGVDPANHLWVGSTSGRIWRQFDGETGELLREETAPTGGLGGYGGFIDQNGVLYSTGSVPFKWDTNGSIENYDADWAQTHRAGAWDIVQDSTGQFWESKDWNHEFYRYDAEGDLLEIHHHGLRWAMGLSVDFDDHLWAAHSHCSRWISRWLPDGTYVGKVEVANHGPTDVTVDRRGYVWATGTPGIVQRINPLGGPIGEDGVTPVGEVDIQTPPLGGSLWAFGEFAGRSVTADASKGQWIATFDGEIPGAVWGPVVWNADLCNDSAHTVEVAFSENGVTGWSSYEPIAAIGDSPSGKGRFIRVRSSLEAADSGESPVLKDLTVGTLGYDAPEPLTNWRVDAGPDIDGHWPDPIQMKGALCFTQSFSGALAPTYAWSVVSADGSVEFDDASLLRPNLTFEGPGDYVLKLTATDALGVREDTVEVRLVPYNKAPYVNAGKDEMVFAAGDALSLSGLVRDDGLPEESALSVRWSKKFGPGDAFFSSLNDPAATVTFAEPGIYLLELAAADGEYDVADSLMIRVEAPCSVNITDGLVSWWQANCDAIDHISANVGFMEGGMGFAEGAVAAAFDFDGDDDRMSVFESQSLDLGDKSGITFEGWFHPGEERNAVLFEYATTESSGVRLTTFSGDGLRFNVVDRDLNDHIVEIDNVLDANVWTHVACTWDRKSGKIALYVNGTLRVVGNTGPILAKTNGNLYFGATESETAYFKGRMDEITLYSVALNPVDVHQIYNAGGFGKCPPNTNLAPQVEIAGPYYVEAGPVELPLSATVTDDGRPFDGYLDLKWEITSGPAGATLSDQTLLEPTLSILDSGIYTVKLSAFDGEKTVSDMVVVRSGTLCGLAAPEGLVAWFPGDGSVVDETGENFILANSLAHRAGIVGSAYDFGSADAAILVPERPGLDIGSGAEGWSVEFWTDPDGDSSGDGHLFEWEGDGSSRGLRLRHQHYRRLVLAEGGLDAARTFGVDTGNYISPSSGWYHIGLTYDRPAGELRFYRDGVLTHTFDVGDRDFATKGDLWIGGRPLNGFYDGGIDELSLYDRPLSQSEIHAIFAAGGAGKCPLDGNRAPAVHAGADIVLSGAGETASLSGGAVDDGLPATGTLVTAWSVVFAPDGGSATFADAGALSTTATFTAEGVYILKLEANDGLAVSSDLVSVRVGNGCMVEAPEGLTAWFPLDYDGLDEVTKLDSVLNDPRWKAGRVGAALDAGAERDAILVPERPGLDIGSGAEGWSVEFWTDPDGDSSGDGHLFEWEGDGSSRGLRLRHQHYRRLVLAEGGLDAARTFGVDTGNYISPSSGWYHIGLTYDRPAGELRFYRDGVLTHTFDVGDRDFATKGDLWIGGRPLNGFYDGGIDELSLYDRPLSQSEIAAIHDAGGTGKCRPSVDNDPPSVIAAFPAEVSGTHAAMPVTARVFDDGLPTPATLSVAWVQVSGPGVASFSTVDFLDPADGVVDTEVIFTSPGVYTISLEATDGAHTTRGNYSVHVREIVNHPPMVEAGDNQIIRAPDLSVELEGFVLDDGLPPGSGLTANWSLLSGPTGAVFADPSSLDTSVTVGGEGLYEFQLAVTDGEFTSLDTVSLTVQTKLNEAPVATITAADNFDLTGSYVIATDVSDDGYPRGNTLVASWRKVSGPGTVGFTPASTEVAVLDRIPLVAAWETEAVFSLEGDYLLELRLSDGAKIVLLEQSVAVYSNPRVWMVYPEAGRVFEPSDEILFCADAHTNDTPVDTVEYFVDGSSIGFGDLIDGTISFPLRASADSLGLSAGRHSVYAVATNAAGRVSISDPREFVVADQSAAAPEARLQSPLGGAVLSAPTQAAGTANSTILDSWTLEYRLQGEPGWTELSTGNAPVTDAELAVFDPTLLLNGLYDLRLSVTDLLGRTVAETITVVIDGGMKVGNFSLAFEDLTVPMAGIPIQIIRSYDSRDTRVGDFGTGWTMAINDIRLQKNSPLGANWYHDRIETTFAGLPSFNYCLQPVGKRLVSVTFPGGEQHLFELSVDVGHGRQDIDANCRLFTPIAETSPVFNPRGDTTATLEAVGADTLYNLPYAGGTDLYTEDPVADPFGALVYNPSRFILTTADGIRYLLDEDQGLVSMEDLNGNRLEVFDDRIVSTAKDPDGGPDIVREVTFTRDGEGRITRITDPGGRQLTYGYATDPQASKGLRTFTNRVDETTGFRYGDSRFPGYLTDILDPRGVRAIRTEYDDEGRIVRQIDADGNPVAFEHDIDNFVERVTDRLGHTTTYTYDALGNVTRQIDPLGAETTFEYYPGTELVKYETDDLGHVTARAYDSKENLLVEITGASTAEEPLEATTGFLTRYRYNEFNSPTEITDPNGNLTEFTYDASGNLLSQIQHGSTTPPLTTTFTYTNGGEIATITDAEGNVTSYSDDYGISDPDFPSAVKRRTVTVTDGDSGILRVTENLYDRQENLLVERYDRTLPNGQTELVQTSYLYDEENRLLAAFLPDGRVAETRYNSIGKEAATLRWQSLADYQANDLSKARVTIMDYDARGNLIRTTYPDGTETRSGYNAGGRMIWSSDQLGRVTAMAYDALGRRTHTIHPGPAASAADLAGLTWNAYSEIPGILADNPTEETLYDSLGRVEFTIDAVGNLTQNIYDDDCACAGRLKETRSFPNPEDTANYLSTTHTYDANGNQRTVTDPKGNTTEFVYDAHNRLVQTNHPSTAEHGATSTRTEYDALGRRVATIDEEGKRTEYTYDARGRLDLKETPVGDLDYSYDEASNLTGITSSTAGGTDVAYTYDGLNRLRDVEDRAARQPPFVHRYGYDANGNLDTLAYDISTDGTSAVVLHQWDYDSRNRLKDLAVRHSPSAVINAYNYGLKATGHRRHMTETQSGRVVTYGYDNLYRLRSETVTDDPNGENGTVTYGLDLLGNRESRISTLPGVSSQTNLGYDARNRLESDDYDANGNTLWTTAETFPGELPVMPDRYDSHNRLIRRATDAGIVDLIYDGDGNRVGKIVNGVATWYLVDTQNLTGYAQVLEELGGPDNLTALASGEPLQLEVAYTYGLDLIAMDRREVDEFGNESWQFRYYTYDGLGSVVALTDATGALTDRYTYDAFGLELETTGSTENAYRYTGEQYDADLCLYYLRARYFNPDSGRFWTMDPFEGVTTDPVSLHKYLYANAAPHMYVDPSGLFSLVEVAYSMLVWSSSNNIAIRNAVAVSDSAIKLSIGMGFYGAINTAAVWASLDPRGCLSSRELHAFTSIAIVSEAKFQSLIIKAAYNLPATHLGLIGGAAFSALVGVGTAEDFRTFIPFFIGTYFEIKLAVDFYDGVLSDLRVVAPEIDEKPSFEEVIKLGSDLSGRITKAYNDACK